MNWKTDALLRIAAALVVLVVGGCVALACAGGDFTLWQKAWHAARWQRSFVTAMEILVALVMAHGLAMLLKPLFRGPLKIPGFWLGKAAAFFPVTCIAWAFVGWWIGHHGRPLWSLMPVTDGRESILSTENWLVWLWTWVPVVMILIPPLTGQCLSLSLEKNPRARDLGFFMLSPLALILAVSIEDILGIKGAGASLAHVLRQPENPQADATAIWQLTGTLLCLAVCIHLPERLGPARGQLPARWPLVLFSSLLKVSAWVLALFFAADLMPKLFLQMMFDEPLPFLIAGWKPTLCALSLWALGHIIRPRSKPSPFHPDHG